MNVLVAVAEADTVNVLVAVAVAEAVDVRLDVLVAVAEAVNSEQKRRSRSSRWSSVSEADFFVLILA